MPVGIGVEIDVADLDTIANPTGQDMFSRAVVDEGKEVIPETGVEIPRRMTPLYNTRTGERVFVNVWRKGDVLKKKHKDIAYPELIGRPVFSEGPTVPPVQGSVKCFLHPDHPMRTEFNKRGYPACPAGSLASEQDAIMHQERSHKSIWNQEQKRREQARQDELFELQKEQIRSQSAQSQALVALVNGGSAGTAPRRGGRPRKPAKAQMTERPAE